MTNTAELDKPKTGIERYDIELIDPEKLHPHPANPPERTKPENLAELLELIERYGQRDPCRARELQQIGQYQLLSGHRRAAACRLLGIDCRVELVECSDEEALREVMLGNAERQDLDPIQRAELMQTMIDSGIDRDEAGAMFGLHSESGIKNCLRLLRLPHSIRAMITTGKLPQRAARALVPYADAPVFLDRVAKEFSTDGWQLNDFIDSPDSFEIMRLDGHTTSADARPMDDEYQPEYGYEKTKRQFEPTAAQLKKLQVATVNHNGTELRIAQNVKLFDKLQHPHLVKSSPYGSPKKKKPAKGTKLTPAQQKAEDKRKAKEAAAQLKKRLPIWRRRFERLALASQTPADSPVILCTIAWWVHKSQMCETWIAEAMETLGCKGSRRTRHDLIALLIAASEGTGRDVVDRLWRVLVWPQRLSTWPVGPIQDSERITAETPKTLPVGLEWGWDDKDLQPQLKLAGVSLAESWKAAAAVGPEQNLLIEFLNLHTTAQLDTLAKTWKVKLPDGATKKAKLQTIIEAHTASKPLPMPKVLQ